MITCFVMDSYQSCRCKNKIKKNKLKTRQDDNHIPTSTLKDIINYPCVLYIPPSLTRSYQGNGLHISSMILLKMLNMERKGNI